MKDSKKKISFENLIIIFLSVFISIIGSISFDSIYKNNLPRILENIANYLYIIFIPLIILLILGFIYFNKYIEKNKNSDNSLNKERIKLLEDTVEELKNLNVRESLKITQEEKEDLLKKLNHQFENNITLGYLSNIEERLRLKNLDERMESSINRIKEEISYLRKTCHINLYFGVILSITAIGIIADKIFVNQISSSNIEQLIMELLPRALLLIFIEIFSLFFLNLYKKNLGEIKYFQNELTNLEGKYLSLYISKENNDNQLLKNILDSLNGTERNFILKKDETTIDLEKGRLEAQGSNNTINALKDIISFKK